MAATFDIRLRSDLDWVRVLISDKDVSRAVLSDEEIMAVLSETGNKWSAAALAGELVIAKTRGLVSKQVADLSLSYSDDAEGVYRKYLNGLRLKGIARTRGVFRVLGDC